VKEEEGRTGRENRKDGKRIGRLKDEKRGERDGWNKRERKK